MLACLDPWTSWPERNLRPHPSCGAESAKLVASNAFTATGMPLWRDDDGEQRGGGGVEALRGGS